MDLYTQSVVEYSQGMCYKFGSEYVSQNLCTEFDDV